MRALKVHVLAAAISLSTMLAVTPTGAGAQEADASAPVLDPVALEALKGMGNYLRTLRAFELHTKSTAEASLGDTDFLVELGYEGVYRVQRPNSFFVQLTSDRTIREFFYDGKTFTVNVPRQHAYSSVPAPATIRQVVDLISNDYDISLPLADLFYWAENPTTDGITSAVRVGFAKIDGQETDQFIFRGPDLDWQLWISRGPAPLPRKIVITNRADPLRPSYSAELTWNTSPTFSARDFTFVPDAKAIAIKMARIPGAE